MTDLLQQIFTQVALLKCSSCVLYFKVKVIIYALLGICSQRMIKSRPSSELSMASGG